MRSSRKRNQQSINVWPGYVDALSSLLMVVIFVLMIFMIVQFLLSEVITGQESELVSLHRKISELTRVLGIEQERSGALTNQVAELSGLMEALQTERQALEEKTTALTEQTLTDKETIERQLLFIASYQEDIATLRRLRTKLEKEVGQLAATLQERETEVGSLRDRSKKLEAHLSDQQERTLLAQREIKERKIRIQALNALVGQQKVALEKEQTLSASAHAEVALLNQRIAALQQQLEEINQALVTVEQNNKAKDSEIKDLGKRLNIALAREVNQLKRYRSEFFGRLQEVLKDVPAVQIEGDRFVFQAELLFDSGSAALQPEGKKHLGKLATALVAVAEQIPTEINWILRIDGHTDRTPIVGNRQYRSNWELSTARALEVVRFLADSGIPEKRMAAAGFSKFHPLDPADTAEAYQKNRRIEIKLTSR
ncbi:MAG: peptidoglycan -binding protein [Thermodesulfobacteriota bacterium]|nr:peptidoglycan -binding protein [Thermodesulfobacteriota bacterium]